VFNVPTDLLTVSDLTYRIKEVLEYEPELQDVTVRGEISNCTLHGSGHAYFTLKDEDAQLSCVMFKRYAETCPRSVFKHGTRVVAEGSVTVYPQRGNYQLLVTALRADGEGDLYREFLRRKEMLLAEGLFDAAGKKPLPPYPRTVGVITSPTGAVIQDILRTLQRRFPCAEVVLAPSLVQGDAAPASVMGALEGLVRRGGVDLVIIARGGGSAEDLWCFNDESLARAVYAYPLPVVSAIGHETDFTILDFVADVRAATPTAAAELVAPDRLDLLAALAGTRQGMLTHLKYRLYNGLQQLDDLGDRINWQKKLLIERQKNQLDLLAATLRQHDPRLFLEKGFSMTLRNGKVVRSAADARPGDVLETILADGRIRSVVVGEEAGSEERE
jgi:exodeoxyribonuclease VII large subunit